MPYNPVASRAGLLSKERLVAGPGFSRWWIAVAALLINLRPLGCCEAVLVRAVYHEFADRRTLLKSLRLNLKPGGLLAIIDFDEGTPEHAAGHGIARGIVTAEVGAAGFELAEAIADWSGNAYCLVFHQPQSPAADETPAATP